MLGSVCVVVLGLVVVVMPGALLETQPKALEGLTPFHYLQYKLLVRLAWQVGTKKTSNGL